MIGHTLSHYRIVSQLGSGGMGLVYRAQDLKLGRQVALKFLAPGTSDPESIERFRREARTASALSHPNICTIFEIDEWQGELFIAMEALDGSPLNRLIAAGPLAMTTALEYAIQVADALEAAHSESVIHRDIKPANLFVTNRGQLKVLDFGLAKVLSPRLSGEPGHESAMRMVTGRFSTAAGSALGTIAYMSPEQARGEILDARSDLFSFGLVFYEMLTGRHTFSGHTSAVIFDAILNRPHIAPSTHNEAVSPHLDRIIAKALEKDRRERYQTAGALKADLEHARRNLERTVEPEHAATVRADAWLPRPQSSLVTDRPSAPPPIPTPSPLSLPLVATPVAVNESNGPSSVAPGSGITPATVVITQPTSHRVLLASIGALLLVVGALGAMVVVGRPRTDIVATPPTSADTRPPSGPADDAALRSSARSETPAASVSPIPASSRSARDTTSDPGHGTMPRQDRESTKAADAEAVTTPAAAAPTIETPAPAVALAPTPMQPPQSLGSALEATLPRDTHPIAAAMFRADTFERDGQPDEAIRVYREAAAGFRGHPRAAEALFRQAQLVANTKPGRRGQGFIAGQAGGSSAYDRATRLMEGAPLGPGAARTILENLAVQHPTSPWALRGLMFKAELEDRFGIDEHDPAVGGVAPASLATYRLVAERFASAPPAEEALWRLAGGYERLGRFDLAATALADLAAGSPETGRPVWFRLGDLYESKLRDAAKARDAYEHVAPAAREYDEAQRRLAQLQQ